MNNLDKIKLDFGYEEKKKDKLEVNYNKTIRFHKDKK